MQQLIVEHKKVKSTNNSKVVGNSEEIVENPREVKGARLSTSRNIFYLMGSKDVYYVQSERSDNIYYYVKYNSSVLEWCSCPDNSMRGQKCKHQFAIEYSIRLGTLKDIEKLPAEAKRYGSTTTTAVAEAIAAAKSYRDDDYDF